MQDCVGCHGRNIERRDMAARLFTSMSDVEEEICNFCKTCSSGKYRIVQIGFSGLLCVSGTSLGSSCPVNGAILYMSLSRQVIASVTL